MSTLKDIIVFIIQNHHNPYELSLNRIIKMIYLADWKAAIQYRKNISGVEWIYGSQGPEIKNSEDAFGSISLIDYNNYNMDQSSINHLKELDRVYLDYKAEQALKYVLDHTSEMVYFKFLDLIYSTLPLRVKKRGEELDLIELSSRYRKEIVAA